MRSVARAAGIVLVALVALTMPGEAAAAPNSCGAFATHFAGAKSSFATSTFGSRARIEYNNPDLCGSDTTDSGASVAWSMVYAHSATQAPDPFYDGYAQVGYGQFAAGAGTSQTGILVFAQWTTKCKSSGTCGFGDQYKTEFRPGGAPEGSLMYENYLSASDSLIHMRAGGTQVAVTGYNPTGDWAAAWQGQFAGEVKHLSDDIVGTAGDPTDFDYLQKYDSAGNINFYQSLTYTVTSTARYHLSTFSPGVGGLGIRTWTDPL